MTSSRIAIIGIDQVSASLAFALQEHEEPIELVGYDSARAVADLAKVRGAFNEVRRKPGLTCEGAGLVILAQPLADMEKTLKAIAPHLEEGAVVTDTARLKAPVLKWAEDLLPDHVTFIGGHLIPNPTVLGTRALGGLDDASPDLVKEALYCLTPTGATPNEAVDVCLWLARAVEATPFFIGVREHDGLLAGVDGLPDLLTVALLRATVDTPGWQEMRKFAGHRFARATEGADELSARRPSLFLNRENILHRLDTLIEELLRLRGVLMEGDEEALSETLDEATEGHSRWMHDRKKGMWTEQSAYDTGEMVTVTKHLSDMLFGSLMSRFRRRPGDTEDK